MASRLTAPLELDCFKPAHAAKSRPAHRAECGEHVQCGSSLAIRVRGGESTYPPISGNRASTILAIARACTLANPQRRQLQLAIDRWHAASRRSRISAGRSSRGMRMAASVCLALGIAFWLQLDNPYWAGASAAAVCQPTLGASFRKAAGIA